MANLEAAFTEFSNQLVHISNNVAATGQAVVASQDRQERGLDRIADKINSQGILHDASVRFSGDSKKFKDWIKTVEKIGNLHEVPQNDWRLIAYRTSEGPVSDYLGKSTVAGQSWLEIKQNLRTRFGEIFNPDHAKNQLIRLRQKKGEGIQVFAYRLLDLAEDAYEGSDMTLPDNQANLRMAFINGLIDQKMREKLRLKRDATLGETVQRAVKLEQNRVMNEMAEADIARVDGGRARQIDRAVPRHFRDDNLNREQRPEPMEVDHLRPKALCFRCNRRGHFAKDCKAKRVNAVHGRSENPRGTFVCWSCGKPGHLRRDCKGKQNPKPQEN